MTTQPRVTSGSADDPLSIQDLSQRIRGAVQSELGSVWIVGEVNDLHERKGHLYLTLVETDADGVRVATLNARALSWERRAFDQALAAAGMTLRDGLHIKAHIRVDYYDRRGLIQAVLRGIDPHHTLGDLQARREMTYRQLEEDGLIDRNKRHALATLPLRIGLVTAAGSDAYEDVLGQLRSLTAPVQVVFTDTVVQGPNAPGSITDALRRLAEIHATDPFDEVIVARGGGSTTDLSCFDDQAVARAIATAPYLVVTGIAHTAQEPIAQLVAHTPCETPTAAGRLIADRIEEQVRRIEQSAAAARTAAEGCVVRAQTTVDQHADALRRVVTQAVSTADTHLTVVVNRAHRATDATINARRDWLDSFAHRISVGSTTTLREQEQRLEHAVDRTRVAAHGAIKRWDARLTPIAARAEGATDIALSREQDRLGQAVRRAKAACEHILDVHRERVRGVERYIRTLDPQSVLARGYTLTFRTDGSIVTSVADVAPGEELTTKLIDGHITSTVDHTHTHTHTPPP